MPGRERVHGPREVLNEMKWRTHDLERALIHYVHRGAPGDERVVTGAEIVSLGHSFMELRSAGPLPAMIPYHRIVLIERDGETVWRRLPRP